MISVVIPVFNEAEALPETLESIASQPGARREVVVIDGGSRDDTLNIAASSRATIVRSERRQRASQMNLGAETATGDVLLFLHGDTVLPSGALSHIDQVLIDDGVVGGCFAKRYRKPVPPFLRLASWCGEVRSRTCGWFFGDQAIFIRRRTFTALSGFKEMDLFEDLDLSMRMKDAGRTVVLRPPVISSARRFNQRGAWRTTWSDIGLTLRFLAAGDPAPPAPGAADQKVYSRAAAGKEP